MVKILKRCLLVGKKILYKSPIDITPPSSSLHAVIERFLFRRNYSNSYISETGPKKKKKKKKKKKGSVNSHILTHSCQFMSQNVQYPSREHL